MAEVDGRIVGLAHMGGQPEAIDTGAAGQLNAIHLDPSWWRRGVGSQLWDGWSRLRVTTAAANESASRFYEAMGCSLRPGSASTLAYLGTTVTTVQYELEINP